MQKSIVALASLSLLGLFIGWNGLWKQNSDSVLTSRVIETQETSATSNNTIVLTDLSSVQSIAGDITSENGKIHVTGLKIGRP